jgi:hypothetical protein
METKHALIIATAIVVGFVAHGLINWGPYQISSGDNLLYRVNQRTGEIHGFASSSGKSDGRDIGRIQIYPMGDNNSTLPRD